MRSAKNKSQFKKILQVVSSNRTYYDIDTVVIDDSALLWTVSWPLEGTVEDILLKLFIFILLSI